jgi:predicted ATPase/class 3 adenylate cyclase
MPRVRGYRVGEVVHVGAVSTVYRAIRESDGLPVILKWLSAPAPTLGDLARYRLSFETTRDLDIPSVSRVLAIEEHERRPLLVMRDIGGITVAERLRERPMSMLEALTVAVGVTEALAQLHARGIVHRDVNPSNVVINEAGDLELIDFDLATRLRVERVEAQSLRTLSGTLAYISPEQTGRMNRTVDHRTDLYALGAMLYEMFSGAVPFAETDSAALIHAHLAVPPRPLEVVAPQVPDAVAAIVMRLLAKAPEDRYQGAPGLRADLERCLVAVQAGAPLAPFALGAHDVSPRLQVSQRLYGREREVERLLGAFGRAAQAQAELVLIAGNSGVGKTALVRELYRPIAARRGRFVWGKHDKIHSVPYAALADALRELVRDILAEPEAEIARWRVSLLDALEGASPIVAELVPDLELVLGRQPAPSVLGPAESQHRFQRALIRFIQAFARPEHPLAIFLDDLHWADQPTLELLRLLLEDSRTRHLLVVAAWRADEVRPGHPLSEAIAALELGQTTVSRVELRSLREEDTAQLLADSLARTPADVAPLNSALYAKTQGNPFFLERFIRSLGEDGSLRFDATTSRWEWDLARIRARDVAENVAALMAQKLQTMPPAVRDVLRLAACIGSHFDLATLGVIAQQAPSAIAGLLWPAIEEELVDPLGFSYQMVPLLDTPAGEELAGGAGIVYRFVHDRIHEAAYGLVPESERPAVHLQIGRLLLGDSHAFELDDRLFHVVNQLDRGYGLLTEPAERLHLARLNRAAGERAIASAAYDAAERYLRAGRDLLPHDAWDSEHALAWDLVRQQAQVALMLGRFDDAAALHALLQAHGADKGQAVDVILMRINQRMRASDPAGAIAEGIAGLALFGFAEPQSEQEWGAAIGAEAAFVAARLDGVELSSLAARPDAIDADAILEMRILAALGSPAYTMPHLLAYLTQRSVRLTLEHGTTPATPMAYVLSGFFACMAGEFERGDAFGRLGLAVHDRLQAGPDAEAPLQHLYATFIHHWRNPLGATLRRMERARNVALQTGNYETAGWAAMNLPWLAFASGAPLHTAQSAVAWNAEIARDTLKHVDIAHALAWTGLQIARLMGHESRREVAAAEGMTEEVILERLAHFVPMLAANRVQRLEVACILESWDEALEDLDALDALLPAAAGSIWVADGAFYGALVRTALLRLREPAQRDAWLARVREALATLENFAANCRENNEAKHLLVRAELGSIDGRSEEASALYEQAVEVARTNGQQQVEGLACERAAAFHERAGNGRLARSYRQDAHFAWVRWGARARVDALERREPALRARDAGTTVRGTVTTQHGDLDIAAVLTATRTISSEIVLESLLARVMTTMIENAGAERGSLILRRGEELTVEAHVAAAGEAPSVLRSIRLEDGLVPAAIVRYVARSGEPLVLDDASLNGRFVNDPYIVSRAPRSVLCTPITQQNRLVGVLYLENRLVTSCFTEDRCALLDMLSGQAAISISNALLYRQQEEMAASMRRFVPQKLLELLGKESILDVRLGDAVERPMTVLFADIRGFTPLSAQMAPPLVFEYLNRYLAEVGPVIRAHGGFIDKYIGDAVMALFPDGPEHGVAATLALLEVVTRQNRAQASPGQPRLRVGIGVHHGMTMLGTIGERMRLEGTVISDTVNTASRLEGMTKLLGADALCSASAFAEVADPSRYPHRYVGALALRGREASLPTVELLSAAPSAVLERRMQHRPTFEAAARALESGDHAGAAEGFAAVVAADPDDAVAAALLKLAKHG